MLKRTSSDFSGAREELIDKIRTCKTQKEAIELAARKGRHKITTLESKFGDALLGLELSGCRWAAGDTEDIDGEEIGPTFQE